MILSLLNIYAIQGATTMTSQVMHETPAFRLLKQQMLKRRQMLEFFDICWQF